MIIGKTGKHKGYPVYITCGNFTRDARNQEWAWACVGIPNVLSFWGKDLPMSLEACISDQKAEFGLAGVLFGWGRYDPSH